MKAKAYHQKYFPDFNKICIAPEKKWDIDNCGIFFLKKGGMAGLYRHNVNISQYNTPGYLEIHYLNNDITDIIPYEKQQFYISGTFSREDISLIITYLTIGWAGTFHNSAFDIFQLGSKTKIGSRVQNIDFLDHIVLNRKVFPYEEIKDKMLENILLSQNKK